MMRQLSEKYKELATRAGRYPKLRMDLYEGTRGEWTDTVEQIYRGEDRIISAVYTNGMTTKPDTFEIGNAYIGLIEMELSGETYSELESGKRFKLYTGFYDAENYNTAWTGIGEFFIESISVESGVTHVKARDKLMYTEQRFDPSKLSYPCSLLDMLREVVRQTGFTLPEGYTLPINPQVTAAPLMKIQSGFKYLMSDGTVLDGRPYPCRQILGEIAKMQLGNCFADGDGNIRFSSYAEEQAAGDTQITNLNIGSEKYRTWVLMYQNDTGSGETEELEENVYGTIYYTTFIPSEKPDFTEQFNKFKNKYFFDGTIEQKGIGQAEIGDFINYSGKLGDRRFFVFGVQYEWRDASFDETLYSFAPTYEQASLSSNNVKAPVSQIESSAEVGESGGGKVYSPGVGINISGDVISARVGKGLEFDETGKIISVPNIQNAVMISEKDAKYLLHSFTEIEYNSGSQIGYAGPGNQIILQEQVVYKSGSPAPNGLIVSNGVNSKDFNDIPNTPKYMTLEFGGGYYSGDSSNQRAWIKKLVAKAVEFNISDTVWHLIGTKEDDTEVVLYAFSTAANWSGSILSIVYQSIYAPGSVYIERTFEFGYVKCKLYKTYKKSNDYYSYGENYQTTLYIPFKSLAEYQAAVGLTYEPLTLTRVEDNPTVVGGNEIKGR